MPRRFLVLAVAIVGGGVLAVAAVMVAVPDPVALRAKAPAELSGVTVAALGNPGPATPAATPEPEPPGLVPVDPVLAAELAALAMARHAELPPTHMPVLGGPTTLYIVQAAERLIIFYYEVEIDPQNYPAPAAPTELFPGLEARACEGAPNRACYVITEALAANACADPVFRPLIDRGAIIRYMFRDLNRRPLSDAAIEAVDCGPATPVAGLP